MSLSMPTTSSPFSEKSDAASDPISPAAPVMMATAISAAEKELRSSRRFEEERLEQRAMTGQPAEDIVENALDAAHRPPSAHRRHRRIVGNVIRNVHMLRVRFAADRGGAA